MSLALTGTGQYVGRGWCIARRSSSRASAAPGVGQSLLQSKGGGGARRWRVRWPRRGAGQRLVARRRARRRRAARRRVRVAASDLRLLELRVPRRAARTTARRRARRLQAGGGRAAAFRLPYGTLHRREVAAYELSRLLGWGIVPPTVERDGPRGIGSMQLFIEHDPAQHYFALRGDGSIASSSCASRRST